MHRINVYWASGTVEDYVVKYWSTDGAFLNLEFPDGHHMLLPANQIHHVRTEYHSVTEKVSLDLPQVD